MCALLAVPASVLAQAIDIDHKPVGCIVAGKYPKLSACFSPSGKLARSRVYFRPENGGANWYYVEMKTGAAISPRSPATRASCRSPRRRSSA